MNIRKNDKELINAEKIEKLSGKILELISKIDQLNNAIYNFDSAQIISHDAPLENLKILTEDDWIRYKTIFREIHTNYYSQIHIKYGNVLSKAELRMMILLKTTQNQATISSMLGISKESVRVCIYRTRIKLKIKTLKELYQLINNTK